MTSSTRYVLFRATPILKLALMLPLYLVLGAEFVKTIRGQLWPYSGFRPISIHVPDHCEGANPTVVIDRNSDDYVTGKFVTWFDSTDGMQVFVARYRSDNIQYRPRLNITVLPKFNEYFWDGADKTLPPGEWVANVEWTFLRPWYSDTVIKIESQPFKVLPKTHPTCTT